MTGSNVRAISLIVRRATVNGREFIRLRIGAFATRAAAESHAKAVNAEKGFAAFVVRADIFIDAFGGAFDIVTTPGGIWQRSAGAGPSDSTASRSVRYDRRDYTPVNALADGPGRRLHSRQ